ncbi:lasso RiPP family leader peptide-containing protein [Streptomyces iconiensis]|uniref:Lasso RiPP family leader peptide-containing protein n=1 Tax=Streptomyces iconiensis TaxID=1384038 RepID=A0ABT6ZW78_9ACTN|nr:lasso RiPP family leader peptide-containing protein [Streptomyces iconiensis]MDJ1133323.1 lasso RiPP family leader peptide-containing protein [Streptomyces iconiensis]
MEQQKSEVYEPPAMVEVGEFSEVTLGPPWGYRRDWHGHSRHFH